MGKFVILIVAIGVALSSCATTTTAQKTVDAATLATLTRQVANTEGGFAKSMADRNHTAFQVFLADEAIFFNGPTPIRGKQAVADAWKKFYEGTAAPFSWEPDNVQVLDTGTLALSTGPVRDPSGKHFANFQSIWRLESPGVWRIVFDRGERVCDCAPKP